LNKIKNAKRLCLARGFQALDLSRNILFKVMIMKIESLLGGWLHGGLKSIGNSAKADDCGSRAITVVEVMLKKLYMEV